MASPATHPAPTPGRRAVLEGVAYDEFVDTRIRKTRAAVKTADLATGAVTLLAWGLTVLLIGAVADHWLVAGGFDRWGRFALFMVGVLGAGLYVATRLGPTLFLRVNPLYAAKEIERESPELKNSLLNLLQLRHEPVARAAALRTALERQAAEGLAATGDSPIDHTPVVRAARVLLVLVAAIGVYVVASPKDFFSSAGRVLAPWADISAPSRVRITDLAPGDAELAQGDRLTLTALITGMVENELAEIVYSTGDGRVVDRRVPMRSRSGAMLHSALLPPGGGPAAALGLQGDITYRLEAGDARTPNYHVEVRSAASIAPVSVRYDYPAYTGFESREVEGVGDLRAIEGTRVTITAEANLPIEAAQIDLGADGRPDSTMRVDGREATGRFTLRRDGSPAQGPDATPTTTNYVLRFTSTDDQANHDPPRYRVEVLADLPPEAAILSPEEAVVEVAVNQRVLIEAEARDPDFALNGLRLVGELNGRRVLNRDLSHGDGRGRVTSRTRLTPREVGAQPGDTLTYWIEATDNRTPEANVGRSERHQLRITGPSEDANADPDRGEPGRNGQPRPGQEDEPDAGESSRGGSGQEPSNPDQNGNDSQQRNPQQRDPGQGEQPQAGERPQAEQADPEQGEEQPGEEGALRGPGEQGGTQGESDDAPEGGSEGQSEGEDGADPQTGGGNAESPAGSDSPEDASNGPGGQNGGASRTAGAEGAKDGQGDEPAPVPSNGEDDGSAFERIRKFLQDQQQQNPNGQPPREAESEDGRSEGGGDSANNRTERNRSESDQEETSQSGEPRPDTERGGDKPRDGRSGDNAERPEDGPGPGEQDRGGRSTDSQSSENGGETPPGESTDPNAGPREGTGSSGQNQSADQGAGQSGDRGAGDSSARPGGEQTSEGESGQPGGEQSGEGSQARDGGNQSGGDSGGQQPSDGKNTDSPSGEPSENNPSGSPSDRGTSGDDGSQGNDQQPLNDMRGKGSDGEATDQQGKPVGFGDRGETSGTAGEGSEVGGDEANLDYAREQTDLVLERLEEQLAKRKVDRKLLDKLGWTEKDLRRFVERWNARKQQAAQRGPEGVVQLDRALRSLGLRPDGPRATRQPNEDQLRDLNEGARTKVPARWRDAVQRYNRSLNNASNSPAAGEE